MPLLARKIDKPTLWADLEGIWDNGDFPFEILSDLKDGRAAPPKGLSVYACEFEDDELLQRLSVAFYLSGDQKTAPSSIAYRFVHTDELTEAGIIFNQTKGALKDETINDKHYDISSLDGPKSLVLAKLLMSRESKIIKQPEILKSLARDIRVGRLERTVAKQACLHTMNEKNILAFSEQTYK